MTLRIIFHDRAEEELNEAAGYHERAHPGLALETTIGAPAFPPNVQDQRLQLLSSAAFRRNIVSRKTHQCPRYWTIDPIGGGAQLRLHTD